MSEHLKALCTTSKCTVKQKIKLQKVNERSETLALDSSQKFYDGLLLITDLKNDRFKVLSESEAEVDSSSQEKQFKKPQTMHCLQSKDSNMTVSYN